MARSRGELFDVWPEWKLGEKRRASAALRLELYHGDYKERVRKLIGERIKDAETATEIKRCVQTAHGVAGTVADVLAVAYLRGCRRELRGASEAAAKAFTDLVDESGIVERAVSLNALSWLTGPLIVVPFVDVVRGVSRLGLHVCTPDRTEVRYNAAAPDVLEAVLWRRDDGAFVEVDALGWRYWSTAGDPLNEGAYTPHGLDYCPAVPFRSRPALAYDWWNSLDHRGLVDATLEVALRHAIGMWVRSQNLADLIVISGPFDDVPKLQAVGHPSRPMFFDAATAGQVDVKVFKRSSNPAEYLAECAALVNAAVSRYGIPPSEVTFENNNTNWGALAINVRGERLAVQRDAQAPWLRRSERALWQSVCAVVIASTHRHAALMPAPDELASVLRVTFPDLADANDQIKRMAAFEAQQKHGLTNAVDLLLQSRPELTRAEAEEELAANIDAYAKRLEELASRNVSMDAQRGVQSIAQVQGREGGTVSGDVRRNG